MTNFGKILIISPHMDDEVLGCGGILAKYAKNCHIHYVTGFHPLISQEVYHQENKNLIKHLGCTASHSVLQDMTNNLATLPISGLISEFEDLIGKKKPDSVFVCFPSYNQDHRYVYDALMTAVRPHDKNWFIKNVFVYEQPETLHTNRIAEAAFRPDVFTEINIEDKIKLYKFYVSQLRGHRNTDTIEALAKLRGSFIAKPYAEAFQCLRLTIV